MNLVDIIVEKRFLGQEFLTWLWFKSDVHGGEIELKNGSIILAFEKQVVLEFGHGDAFETINCRGLMADFEEARTALQKGKKLEQARLHFVVGQYEWHMTIKASTFDYRSVKLPKTIEGIDTGITDVEAVQGFILDRMGILAIAYKTIDELFMQFVQIRIGAGWDRELAALRGWINK